jgi:imidazolonepropionase-like amidohydrolase
VKPFALAVLCALGFARVAAAEDLVIEAERLHPVSGPAIESGVVVVRDGRIAAVGKTGSVSVPAGARVLRAKVVTPGFIDAHSSVGLSGLLNVPDVLDQDERAPGDAELRAIDGFNPDEPLLRYLLEHGVTLIQAGPGPNNPIAGQAGIFRTYGRSADAMAVRFPSAVVFNLGDVPKREGGEVEEAPRTRMGTAALIRRALSQARGGQGGGLSIRIGGGGGPQRPALERVARGELPAIFTAHRADDLLTAARIAREFDLNWFLAGATDAYLIAPELRAANARILVGPVMERPEAIEAINASYENAAVLNAAGIPLAIRSGFEEYVPRTRVVLFEAALAAANGLAFDQALRAITLAPAELLGVAKDHGSLEPGKVADLALFDGDPFEYVTHVSAVVAGGNVVHERRP